MINTHDVLVRKLQEHSTLVEDDITGLRGLTAHQRIVGHNEEYVRQGDRPHHCAIVLAGLVGRYHTSRGGRRQYLSFHLTGDMPDAQSLFLERMDHSVCAIGTATIGLIPHEEILTLFTRRTAIGLAIWRETLIDAAIFRDAITNNGSRPALSRMAHLFCEMYYRSRSSGLAKPGSCELPLSQSQIGEAAGMSIVTVNRTLQSLRQTGTMDFRGGTLTIRDWKRLATLAEFDPNYLHSKRISRM